MNTKTKQQNTGFMALLKNKRFRLLLGAESISLIGDRIVAIALIMLVYDMTESAATVSILMMLKAFPSLIFGSIAGGLVDRMNKKWVMIFSHIVQGILILCIPISNSLLVIYGVYLCMSIVNQLFIPARAAVMPELVSKESLMPANSLFSMAYVGAIAFGPALGGFLIDFYGLNMAFYVDAFSFFLPAIALFFLAIPHTPHKKNIKQSFWKDLKKGFQYIKNDTELILALFLSAIAYLGIGAMSVLGIILAEEILHIGASGYGIMMSAMGVGLLIGAVFTGKGGRKYKKIHLAIYGSVIAGVMIGILPYATLLYMAIIVTMIVGLGTVLIQTSANTLFQLTPKEVRGKVIGISQSCMGAASFLAMGLAGILTEFIGIYWVLGIVGGVGMVGGGMSFMIYHMSSCQEKDEEKKISV
jgi:MFS family permease